MVKVNSLNDIESGGPKRPSPSSSNTTSSSTTSSSTSSNSQSTSFMDRFSSSGLVLFGKQVQPVHLAMATIVAILFFGMRGLLVVGLVVGLGMCYTPSASASFGSGGRGGGGGRPSSGGNGGGSSGRIRTIKDLPKPPPSS
eukprot:TRINITY_DN1115_c0_g1_i1.p1 TRINITY_DN1115_c0_g1~~TRINITY_DN1115_c0_g1_i1.p1  ORF type:complete len:141 (+),score=53.43 TRINITY_DN1115_c0_g1_i1:56-478(+)